MPSTAQLQKVFAIVAGAPAFRASRKNCPQMRGVPGAGSLVRLTQAAVQRLPQWLDELEVVSEHRWAQLASSACEALRRRAEQAVQYAESEPDEQVFEQLLLHAHSAIARAEQPVQQPTDLAYALESFVVGEIVRAGGGAKRAQYADLTVVARHPHVKGVSLGGEVAPVSRLARWNQLQEGRSEADIARWTVQPVLEQPSVETAPLRRTWHFQVVPSGSEVERAFDKLHELLVAANAGYEAGLVVLQRDSFGVISDSLEVCELAEARGYCAICVE